jgi:dinuclear metal center YbgI/SA1388 family protein
MKIKDITSYLESIAPIAFKEDYDNCGLLVGNAAEDLKGILITLDCTEEVIEEALTHQCNLIISHHPVIFKPLRKITGEGHIEKTILKAIINKVAIYAIHTNLDNILHGVNFKIAEKLGLQRLEVLQPKANVLKKLITFVPPGKKEDVLNALHGAGAGRIGNYSECSYSMEGTGTFKPEFGSFPAIGKQGIKEHVKEERIEVVYYHYLEIKIMEALKGAHPYETPAYDLISLHNADMDTGSGIIGELPESMEEPIFLKFLKHTMNISLIRCTAFTGKKVQKIALCGGSGSFLLPQAKKAKADVFISSDFKYHEFFDAEKEILIADINHYEGEVYTKELIYEFLYKKFANIALVLSSVKTNPISYF